jgi:hypothetical protein
LVILQFFLFIAVAALGGIIGTYSRLPDGTMIGAMFAVGIIKHFEFLSFHRNLLLPFFVGSYPTHSWDASLNQHVRHVNHQKTHKKTSPALLREVKIQF